MKINLIKISSYETEGYNRWNIFGKDLKNFFKYWVKEKLNQKTDVNYIDYFSSDSTMTLSRLDIITHFLVNSSDINVYIIDKRPSDFNSQSLAFMGQNWIFAIYTAHPLGPLYSLTRLISHELLHKILKDLGLPKEIWITKVDADAQLGNLSMDYWRKTIAQYFYGPILDSAGFMKQPRRTSATLYSTQGGEYLQLINNIQKN